MRRIAGGGALGGDSCGSSPPLVRARTPDLRRRISHAEATELRRTAGATLALFLTDRCPVGCGHCSVSSRVDSPTITDWDLFHELVAGICALPSLQAVAITGGEPFAERRGLIHAVESLHTAGIAVILFTSGHWATRDPAPPWISDVLSLTCTVYLSTDSFHAITSSMRATPSRPRASPVDGGPFDVLRRAAEMVERAGCQLVIQVLDEPGAIDVARGLSATADISVNRPLAVGRGREVFAQAPVRPVSEFGRCGLLNSPTVRYDGTITACCNEAVIMGTGPGALRRTVHTRQGVPEALGELAGDPVLRVMGRLGAGALESIVQEAGFRSICDPCWSAHARVERDPKARAMVTLLAEGVRRA